MAHGPTGSLAGAEPKPTHQTIHLVEYYSISARTLLHNAVSVAVFVVVVFLKKYPRWSINRYYFSLRCL